MNIRITLGVLVAGIILLGIVLPRTVVQPQASSLPELGTVGDFTLSDIDGRSFASSELLGDVWVANFFFTSCRGICPTMMGEIEKVQRQFADSAAVQFVSITVDPEKDTADVLANYKKNFAAANERWHFLTGPVDTIRSVSESGFMLAAGEQPAAHSRRVVLVDSKGVIRGFYDGLEKNVAQQIIRDTVALVEAGGQ